MRSGYRAEHSLARRTDRVAHRANLANEAGAPPAITDANSRLGNRFGRQLIRLGRVHVWWVVRLGVIASGRDDVQPGFARDPHLSLDAPPHVAVGEVDHRTAAGNAEALQLVDRQIRIVE